MCPHEEKRLNKLPRRSVRSATRQKKDDPESTQRYQKELLASSAELGKAEVNRIRPGLVFPFHAEWKSASRNIARLEIRSLGGGSGPPSHPGDISWKSATRFDRRSLWHAAQLLRCSHGDGRWRPWWPNGVISSSRQGAGGETGNCRCRSFSRGGRGKEKAEGLN